MTHQFKFLKSPYKLFGIPLNYRKTIKRTNVLPALTRNSMHDIIELTDHTSVPEGLPEVILKNWTKGENQIA